jgi:hypothetical protein
MAVDDSYTKALLHMDGSDASTTFTDESGKTWTRSGNAQIDTAQYVFGGASGLFDGTGDCIGTPDNADFDIGAGDFTFDFRIRFAAIGGAGSVHLLLEQNDSASQRGYGLGLLDGTTLYFFWTTDGTGGTFATVTASWSPSINIWYHIAVTRSGTSLRFFINGTQIGSTGTISATIFNSNQPFEIAGGLLSSNYTNGWIDEFRFSKGIARWTSNFTPPTAPYGIGHQVIWSS